MPVVGGGTLDGRVGLDFASSVPVRLLTMSPQTRHCVVELEWVRMTLLKRFYLRGSLHLSEAQALISVWGFLKRLDFYYTRNPGLRFQFRDPNSEGGWVATVFAGPYQGSQERSTTISGDETKVDTDLSGTEYGFSVDYRPSPKHLLYFTAASRGGKADIEVIQLGGNTFEYQDDFDHYIGTLSSPTAKSFLLSSSFLPTTSPGVERVQTRAWKSRIRGTETGFTAGLGYRWWVS